MKPSLCLSARIGIGKRPSLSKSAITEAGQKAPGLEPGAEGPSFLASTHALCSKARLPKAFRYRWYPNHEQQRLLERQLAECRWLYNHLLAERRAAWEQRQEAVRLYDQHATRPALKAERPALVGVQSQVWQNVAVRIDLAFKAFFRRGAAGEKPGYPRFRGAGRGTLRPPHLPARAGGRPAGRRYPAPVRHAWWARPAGRPPALGRHAQDGDELAQEHRQVVGGLLVRVRRAVSAA
jgi:hypothetical protein